MVYSTFDEIVTKLRKILMKRLQKMFHIYLKEVII